MQNEHHHHGRVKWYKIKNLNGDEFSVRGTWELNVAKRLNALGILWIKPKPIKYVSDRKRNYVADLYVPSMDVYK